MGAFYEPIVALQARAHGNSPRSRECCGGCDEDEGLVLVRENAYVRYTGDMSTIAKKAKEERRCASRFTETLRAINELLVEIRSTHEFKAISTPNCSAIAKAMKF